MPPPQKLRDELTKNEIDNLVFVPNRITNYIPMAALHNGKNHLIETFAVSNILSVGLTDTQDKLPDRPSVLGFGLSNAVTLINPDRSFSSLPFVPIELEGIVKKANASSDPVAFSQAPLGSIETFPAAISKPNSSAKNQPSSTLPPTANSSPPPPKPPTSSSATAHPTPYPKFNTSMTSKTSTSSSPPPVRPL